MSMPMETITSELELARAGFYWRKLDGVQALDGERPSAVAVEERPEHEARIRTRPAEPLDGSVPNERAVRAVADDAEAARHG